MQLRYLFFTLALTFSTLGFGQQTIVQSFTYDSTSRSMTVDFPDGDHNDYEKILMYYSMRCKDGLVSTGTDRNKGCGEWDYSCNTFITDSTRLDSFRATALSHTIQGYTETTFDYSIDPTFVYYQSTLRQVTYNSVNSETDFNFDAGMEPMRFPMGTMAPERKTQFLYRRGDLMNAGLSAGIISGLRLNVVSGDGEYPRLRIRIMETDIDELNGYTLHSDELTEVFNDDFTVSGTDLFFRFYRDFTWSGNSNILIEMSYSSATDNQLTLEGGTTDYASAFNCDGGENVAFHSEGEGSLDIEHDLNFSGNEISISFWYLGSESQPRNSTIFEGVDEANLRQVNVHMPWGDGTVYWDCGNDGGGYDRISKFSDEFDEIKKWNHWTFTKNANTGFMRVYLNGEPWSIGLNKQNPITINTLRIGSSANENRGSFAQFDNFQIYDKELTGDEIKSIMSRASAPGQDLYDHLVLDYDFNQLNQGPILDRSQNQFHATLKGRAYAKNNLGRFLRSEADVMEILPDITFVRGSYNRDVTDLDVLDQLENSPYTVLEYEVVDNNLQLKDEYLYYLSGFAPVYDENGDLVDALFINPDGTITIEELVYYIKRPSKYEIMSFVTPYGIGIDFGLQGKTWIFDVTDFAPILKGQKKISMEFGGQRQEEMDIKFVFVHGTPARDVLGIQQIWPVTQEPFTRISNNTRFEERTVKLSSDATSYVLKAAVTGHGQEGEFIPRTHYLNVNGGARELEWTVWKECADNPIYPQGGTWIYDRAGWCPGAPTDIRILPLENINPGSEIAIDYGINTATGDSRYIVNVQLVSFGDANFNRDAELVEIINPSPRPEFERFNPMCGVPRVKIRNSGSNTLTSAQIVYGVVGRQPKTYNWTGSLEFLEETEVSLFPLRLDQAAVGHEFYARIQNPNGGMDEYGNNDERSNLIPFIPAHKSNIIIELRTNNFPNETSWKLFNDNGDVLKSRGGGLQSNTIYRDTITNMEGCYRLLVEDTDEDGISWWANGDGNGYVQIRDIGGGITSVATDFGKYVQYEFVTEGFVPTNEAELSPASLGVYPNPGLDKFTISITDYELAEKLVIRDGQGKVVMKFEDISLFQEDLELNLTGNPAGVYFAELIGKKSSTSVKFIKL